MALQLGKGMRVSVRGIISGKPYELACEQAPVGDSRVQFECSLGRTG